VMEKGVWELPDGLKVEAGTIETDKDAKSGEYEQISLQQDFSDAPLILHSLNSYENGEFMSTIAKDITSSMFRLAQERLETGNIPVTETIGWIAVEKNKLGMINGIPYETYYGDDGASDGVDNTAHRIPYSQSFSSTPIVIVKQNTRNGGDGGYARGDGTHTSTIHDVYSEEDQIGDSERSHTNEYFGAWAFDESFAFGTTQEAIKLTVDEDPSPLFNNSLEGHYPATYSFEEDENGNPPDGWTCSDTQVIDSMDGHDKVTESNAGNMKNYDINGKQQGFIEFWYRTTDISTQQIVFLAGRDSYPYRMFRLDIKDGQWYSNCQETSDDRYLTELSNPLDDQWNHITIHFCKVEVSNPCVSSGKWKVVINGEESNELEWNKHYGGSSYEPDYSRIGSGCLWYADAIGYSWDPNYEIGDNMQPTSQPIGHYHGTYSFEEDEIGSDPSGFTITESGSSYINVEAEQENHQKVMTMSHDGSNDVQFEQDFSPQTSGTVEFWFYHSDNWKNVQFMLQDGSSTYGVRFKFDNEHIIYYDGSAWNEITSFSGNQWYHIRIDFNCTTDTYDLYLDYVLILNDGEFDTPLSSVSIFWGKCIENAVYKAYIDAIGYSWDENYNIGDNILATSHPKGHYPATFSFEDDDIGSNPNGWTVGESGGSINVIGEKGNHEHIVELKDTSGSDAVYMYDNSMSQDKGEIEFWLNFDDIEYAYFFYGYDANDQNILFRLNSADDGKLEYRTGGGGPIEFFSYSTDTWYHLRLKFDSDTDKFSVWINGNLEINNKNFYENGGNLEKVRIYSAGGRTLTYYIDAIGYSWDPNYDLGDNIYPSSTSSLTSTDVLSGYEEYYLEIPDIGAAYGGNVSWTLESVGIPDGRGNVSVQFLKRDRNLNSGDEFIYQEIFQFDNLTQFSLSKFYDLSNLKTSGRISKYYGKYVLRLKIYSENVTDTFYISDFQIQTETYIIAEVGDTQAWITDPAASDTDSDGWNDYDEIFTHGTNPTDKDSDQDGANDPDDRDPHGDVIIGVEPYSAYMYEGPLLQIVSYASYTGSDEICIKSNKVTSGSSETYFSDSFYFNIDDEDTFTTISFDIEFYYGVEGFFDVLRLSGTDTYTIGETGNYEMLSIQDGSVYAKVNVSTLIIQRVNTIAIYDPNETSFVGHYQEKERMNVFQLNVNTSGHYVGTFSFNEDRDGEDPIGWGNINEAGGEVNVRDYKSDHSKVLELKDTSTTDYVGATSPHFADRSSGWIEFKWTEDGSDCNQFVALSGNIIWVIYLLIDIAENYKYFDGTGWNDVGVNCVPNQFDNHSIYFDCATHTFDWYINDVLVADNAAFNLDQGEDATYIDHLDVFSAWYGNNVQQTGTQWIDAIGIVGEEGYQLGDNMEEYNCENTPFIEGPNSVVVPTSLFTETVLNGYIENGRVNETILYSDVEGEYDVYSVDRSGKPVEKGAGDGDFVFTRYNLLPYQAMEILNMILTCVINDTTNETAACYEHYSTKLNSTKASMMNLPVATMAAIGWDCRYESSEEGPDPTPSGGWDPQTWLFVFGILFLTIISFGTVILVMAIALIVTESADAIAEAIQKAMMAIISFLAHLVWLAIRAALLVFAYIMLAIELLFISTMVLGMGVPMLVISLFIDMEVTFGLNWAVPYGIDTCAGWVQFDTEESTLRKESWIVWYYWAFFDIYILWVEERTISNDHMIMNNTYSITSTESHEEYSEPPREALEEEVSPQLFGNNFSYAGTDLYNFTVKYDDLNLESPDDNYGVKLHLIKPDGTALQGIEMVPIDTVPDYTEKGGVSYTYELDTSTYDDGIWHYFFSTKDKQTGKTVIFPNQSYFMGPDTYNISYYLISPHVNTTIDIYHESDGWADEDWSFQIHWWDMVEENAPQDVTLCLIPASKEVGQGQDHTKGIQKFTMSLADATPNCSNPMEYRTTLNFDTLNYLDDELGIFYYYFEATRQDGKVTKSPQYKGPYVRSINKAEIRLEITSSDNIAIQNVLESDSEMVFSLEYSDPNTIPQSEMPTLNLTSDTQNYEFDFKCYEISADERMGWYVLYLNGSDFKAGTYDVSIETPDGWNTNVVPNMMGLIHNLNFGGGILGQMSSSFLLQGIIPLGMLAGAGAFALMEDLTKFKVMAIFSLTTLIFFEVATLIALLNSDDNGGLFGFSLANLIIQLIMVATISKDLRGILNGLAYLTYFSSILSTILILSANTAGLFGMDMLEDILYVSDNILNVLILGVPVAIACITINIILGLCLGKKGSKCPKSFKKLIYGFMGIYLIFFIVGFIVFGLSFN